MKGALKENSFSLSVSLYLGYGEGIPKILQFIFSSLPTTSLAKFCSLTCLFSSCFSCLMMTVCLEASAWHYEWKILKRTWTCIFVQKESFIFLKKEKRKKNLKGVLTTTLHTAWPQTFCCGGSALILLFLWTLYGGARKIGIQRKPLLNFTFGGFMEKVIQNLMEELHFIYCAIDWTTIYLVADSICVLSHVITRCLVVWG